MILETGRFTNTSVPLQHTSDSLFLSLSGHTGPDAAMKDFSHLSRRVKRTGVSPDPFTAVNGID